jgi:hypothetical protein
MEAKGQLGRVAQGENPAEERQLDHKAITVKELCHLYLRDLEAGLILGKGGHPDVAMATCMVQPKAKIIVGTMRKPTPTKQHADRGGNCEGRE